MFIQFMVTASYTCMNACSIVDYSFSLSACSIAMHTHACILIWDAHTCMGRTYMWSTRLVVI